LHGVTQHSSFITLFTTARHWQLHEPHEFSRHS
jgi:hypothetical protein